MIDSAVPAAVKPGAASGRDRHHAISSFAYAQNAEDYILLPDLSVSRESGQFHPAVHEEAA